MQCNKLLPIRSPRRRARADRAQEGGAGDVVVADVVDLEAAGGAAAQQHVGGVAAVEAAERDKRPIGSDLAQRVACQDRVVADVVDLVSAGRLTVPATLLAIADEVIE
jgi:hypothetical protein